jgi:hypothetical protein
MRDMSDLFDDIPGELRRIEQGCERLREEAQSATPERRREIGWWMWGASKHRGRLMDAAVALGQREHRFVIHEMDDDGMFAVCCCGARFPGEMHEDFTLDEFVELPGHRDLTGADRPASHPLDGGLR